MDFCFFFFFFFKQKTAYDMRISYWSSDVCSSDLGAVEVDRAGDQDRAVAVIDTQSCVRRAPHLDIAAEVERPFVAAAVGTAQGVSLLRILRLVLEEYEELGRASCRERVCKYV